MIDTKALALGLATTALVCGAYFLGAFQGQQAPMKWREGLASLKRSLTWQGFAWSVALPVAWLALFYGLVIHVRLALGGWPRFGQQFDAWPLRLHEEAVFLAATALVASLWVMPLVLVGSLCFRRWRHISIYTLSYGAALGMAFGGMLLAPHAFLNWFFD